jgi:hypothetical protein
MPALLKQHDDALLTNALTDLAPLYGVGFCITGGGAAGLLGSNLLGNGVGTPQALRAVYLQRGRQGARSSVMFSTRLVRAGLQPGWP